MMYRNSRQAVTGLVVNRKINVRTEYRRTVRAMVHRLIRSGSFDVLRPTQNAGTIVLEKRPGRLNELHGMLGFIDGIDEFNHHRNPRDVPAGLEKKENPYRQFLLYSQFYAAPAPVIVCEGDTDNVYLTHAIRALAANYPDLAEIKKGGKIQLKVRLYKYPRSSTARILGLHDGGSSVLSKFIFTYRDETDIFKAPGMTQPVALLFDNDSGAKSIHSAAKQLTKHQVTVPFLRLVKNVYAVPTPLPPGATESKIEDFFDAATKAIPYNGKTFHDGPGFDSTKHIGKQIFAHRVVRPNAAKISFDGFKPLLDSLVAVIQAHRASLTPNAPAPAAPPTTPSQAPP
jgi:RNA-directed DNA polymerase